MVGRLLAAAILSLACLPLALPAGAQNPAAPHLDTANNILYAHWDGADFTYMNTLPVDSDDSNYGTGSTTGGSVAVVTSFTWDFLLTPPLAADVRLDTTKDAVATMYIGGNAGAGRLSVTTKLVSDATTIWEGTSDPFLVTPGVATDYTEVVVTAKPALGTIPVGKPLHWTITVSGTATASFLGMSEARGRTNLALPVTSAAPAAVAAAEIKYGTLPAGPVDLDLAVVNKTSATYHYNWTAPAGEQSILFGATVTSGSVQVEVQDASNKTHMDQTATATGNKTAQTKSATSGVWRITLRLAEFEGAIALSIDGVSKAGGATSAAPAATGGGGTTAVVGATDDKGGAAPGAVEDLGAEETAPHLGVAGLALALAFAARRKMR